MSDIKRYITKEGIVHAYGIEGSKDVVTAQVTDILKNSFKISVVGNPDFRILEYGSFGVGDARELEEAAYKRPMAGDKKFFIISFNTITREAQNALLKLFEEPVKNTHFFIVARSLEILLPTLRSRLFLISEKHDALELEMAQSFVAARPSKRIEILKEIIDTKDKAKAVSFLNELEVYISNKIDFSYASDEEVLALKEIEKARDYMGDRAPSVKMLLENIALSVPVK